MSAKPSVCIIIPARLGSTRLPEKALADICGKPMIQRVYEQACKVSLATEVLVATDHPKIQAAVTGFGGKSVMTPSELASGTDRVAFVAHERSEDIIVNIQGDEPLVDPQSIERAIELVANGQFEISTLAAPLQDQESIKNLNVVKVLVGNQNQAIYFSRYPIPYSREQMPEFKEKFIPKHHLGVYVYTRNALLRFSKLEPTPLEKAESLEQLRALFYGIPIGVAFADKPTVGVDTQEDLDRVRRFYLF